MADNKGGISWFIRMVLDEKSVEDVKKDAREALDEGTDPKQPKKNIAEVEGAFAKLKRMAIQVGAVLGSMWVVRQVIAYGKAVFDLGAKVNATESQFRTVFGTIADGLEASLAGWRKIAGVTDTELRRLLAAAGSMGQGMGMTTRASADFASEVVKLAGDLASFSGGAYTTEAAAQLLQSALIGNTEAARALLINFTALDVQQRAMEMTGKRTADALTQEEKALAGLSVITERAGPQLGDLVRTQKDADNQAKILAATWRQMREDIAYSLLPVFDALFTTLEDTRAVDRMAAAAKALAENMGELVALVVSFGKALLIGGVVAGVVRLTGAIRAANLATVTFLGTMRAGLALVGPAGWFVLGVAALTTAFQKSGEAAREAKQETADYLSTLKTLSREDLTQEFATASSRLSAIGRQIANARSMISADEALAGDEGARRQDRLDAWGRIAKNRQALQNLIGVQERVREQYREITRALSDANAANQPLPIVPDPADEPLTDAEKKAAEARVRALWEHLGEWMASERSAPGLAGDTAADRALRAERERRERARAAFEEAGGSLTPVPELLGRPVSLIEPQAFSQTEELFFNLWQNVESASRHAAYEMASAFEDAFQLMREEGVTIGNLFEGLGRGMAGSMLQGLADFARGKSAEASARAIEGIAKALLYKDPGAAASVPYSLAEAVAWGALAGGAGAGRAAVTGGRGAVPVATRDAGLNTVQNAKIEPVKVEVYLEPFNPENPVHARQAGRALDLNVHLAGRPAWARK